MTDRTTVTLFWLCLAVGGCAEDAEERYAHNLRQAYVTAWTRLSAADRSEIVRLVSAATGQRIQGICSCTPNSKEISVFTSFPEGSPRWTLFLLEKHGNRWQIMSKDSDFSSAMATAMLSYPP
jgi:hypothetical protein